MARSKETFSKKEREKKRLKQRQDKLEKMEERKANLKKGKSLDEMMAYIDENGNLSSMPPDPKKRKIFNREDMNTGVPVHVPEDTVRQGIVSFFNEEKGFGFIKDTKTQESVFVHSSQLTELIKENNRVSYEAEQGPKGPVAIKVKKTG